MERVETVQTVGRVRLRVWLAMEPQETRASLEPTGVVEAAGAVVEQAVEATTLQERVLPEELGAPDRMDMPLWSGLNEL